MKRTYTLFVLLGIVVGSLLTGCDSGNKPEGNAQPTSTNAPAAPAATPDAVPPAASTNK